METIVKFLSSLKENERSIVISSIANALIFYLLGFITVYQFKNYVWYQEVLLSFAISICYIITFYIASLGVAFIFNISKKARDFFSFITTSSIIWYNSILALAYATGIEFIFAVTYEDHEFSFEKFLTRIVCICCIPSIISFFIFCKDIYQFIKRG